MITMRALCEEYEDHGCSGRVDVVKDEHYHY